VTASGHSESVSNDLGEYRLFGLTAGDYVISASAPTTYVQPFLFVAAPRQGTAAAPNEASPLGVRQVAYSLTYYPGRSSLDAASVIRVTAGQQVPGIDIPLRLVPTARVAGRVMMPNGLAVREPIRVVLRSGIAGEQVEVHSTSATNEGAFAFADVSPGEYTVFASVRLGTEGRSQAGSSPDAYWAEAKVALAGQDLENLQMNLIPGGSLTGRVILRGGSSSDELRFTRIRLKSVGMNPSTIVASVQPNGDGSFGISGVLPGKYVLGGLSLPSATTDYTVASMVAGSTELQDRPMIVTSDSTQLTGIDVVFSQATSELSGFVVEASGGSVTDLLVTVFPTDRSLWFEECWRVRLPNRVSQEGAFRIRGLPAGEYFLAAVPGNILSRWPESSFFEDVASSAVKITLAQGEKRTQNLVVRNDY
jgi:hypothetical protein